MLQKEQIFHLLKDNKCPYWKLFLKETPWAKSKLITNYEGDNIDEANADKEGSAIVSIEALERTLSIYDNIPEISFEIIIRPTKTSNGEKVLGPFAFKISRSNATPQGNGNAPGYSPNGLGGMPGAPVADYASLGYIHKNQVQEMLAVSQDRSMLSVEKILLERDKKEWEEQKKAEEDELKEKFVEYSDLVSAGEKAAKRGVLKGAIKLLHAFTDGKDISLSGTEETKKEPTAEELILQDLIDFINEKNLSIEELKKLTDIIKNVVTKNIVTKKEEEKE